MYFKRYVVEGIVMAAAAAFSMGAAADAMPHGQIKVCRRPGVTGAADHKPVKIEVSVPSTFTWTYTGTCDSVGDNCRDIVVAVTAAGEVGTGQGQCAVLPAVLVKGDGKPLKAGQYLLPQWTVPGFEPVVTVTETFR